MKPIFSDFNSDESQPKYIQLYEYLRKAILKNEILPGEKLPSLRSMAKQAGLSVSTVERTYYQLIAEGYIDNKPQSGYYVRETHAHLRPQKEAPQAPWVKTAGTGKKEKAAKRARPFAPGLTEEIEIPEPQLAYDLACFDFNRWKKCLNKVLVQYPQNLLFEGDPQGEEALRIEIAKYVYVSRGVDCQPDQIVIGAGTQQLTGMLASLLQSAKIYNIALESPGYLPVHNIFKERGFSLTMTPVTDEGIEIESLPWNIRAAAYVNPSNQFPTGAVMSVGRRHQLLDWARRNRSYIIEDDYDSELRYFGKPLPALKSLDAEDRVVYLGSFSSTLFASIKISYMVLPHKLEDLFKQKKADYIQTCSKTEQLALAIFMKDGYYQKGIKKMRNLYAQKLDKISKTVETYSRGFLKILSGSSGINLLLSVKTKRDPSQLSQLAASLGLSIVPAGYFTTTDEHNMIFNYNKVPLEGIENKIEDLIDLWIG